MHNTSYPKTTIKITIVHNNNILSSCIELIEINQNMTIKT